LRTVEREFRAVVVALHPVGGVGKAEENRLIFVRVDIQKITTPFFAKFLGIGEVHHLVSTTEVVVGVSLCEKDRMVCKLVKLFVAFFEFSEEWLRDKLLILLEPRVYFFFRGNGVVVVVKLGEKLIQ